MRVLLSPPCCPQLHKQNPAINTASKAQLGMWAVASLCAHHHRYVPNTSSKQPTIVAVAMMLQQWQHALNTRAVDAAASCSNTKVGCRRQHCLLAAQLRRPGQHPANTTKSAILLWYTAKLSTLPALLTQMIHRKQAGQVTWHAKSCSISFDLLTATAVLCWYTAQLRTETIDMYSKTSATCML
jgi:hypothetical protein